METDVTMIYNHLRHTYPVQVTGALEMPGYGRSGLDFPVLHGISSLGRFELIYDDISFPFYFYQADGKLSAHWHFQTLEDAEKGIAAFMEGHLTPPRLPD